MNFEEAELLAEDYRKKINYHNNLYYNNDSPEIEDFEYDMLLKNLEEIENTFPELKIADSPTNFVGGNCSAKFSPVRHDIKMESLHNSYNLDEMVDFFNRTKKVIENPVFVVEPKIDGLSVSIEYRNSRIFRASTRGDGEVGEDITQNILTIKSLPKKLPVDIPFLEVRGEVYMPKKSFLELVKKQEAACEKPFKNPRNAAAGSLRQKNHEITAERNLEIIIFNVQKIKGVKIASHRDSLDYLKTLGFAIPPFYKLCNKIEDISTEIKKFGKIHTGFSFQTDGAVIKIDSFDDREKLGSTSKYPRWAEAFKYPPEEKETKLLKIEVEVGRTGVLTPVAIFEPVTLGGTVIARATLHNEDFIKEKDVRIGDTVALRKAGDIIPKLEKIIKHAENSLPFKMPKECPSCGSEIVKIDNESALRCINSSCSAQLFKNVLHFVSRDAMNIDGLGETIIKKIIDQKLINSPSNLYNLKPQKLSKIKVIFKKKINPDQGTFDNSGENSYDGKNYQEFSRPLGKEIAQTIINNIELSKTNGLERLIFALGIKNVGQKASKILALKFKNMYNLMNSPKSKISEIDGIGEIMAENIVNFFSLPETISYINNLKKHGINMDYQA